MSGHVVDQQSLAVTAPGHALVPYAELPLGDFGDVRAVDAEDHDQAVCIVERKVRRVVRAVLRGQRDIFAVKRNRQALDDLADVERVDNARGFAFNVDHADRVDVTLPAALETDNGGVAFGRELDGVRPDCADQIFLGVGDGGAVDEKDRNRWWPSRVTSAILPSGENAALLGPDFGLLKSTLPATVTVLPENGQHRNRPVGAVGDQRHRSGAVDADPSWPEPGLDGRDDRRGFALRSID